MVKNVERVAPSPKEADDERILRTYQAMFKMHGVEPASLGIRPNSQEVRFAAVWRLLTPVPESLLDLGCGFGDLLGFLRRKGWRGHYSGIDFMPDFIQAARQRYRDDPAAAFLQGHLLEANLLPKSFDACVSNGLCNNKREAGSKSFNDALVSRAVALARRTVVVDFLSQTSDRRREDLFFTDARDALGIGLRHSRRVILDHSYMPFECMLKINLDDEVEPELPYFSNPT